jgi:hypothetical protein
MTMNTQIATAAINAQADALSALLNNGYLRIYSGTQPTNANTALSGNTLLAELRFSATAAPAASGGVITFNAITADSSADNTGTATFFRAFKSDGTSVVMDGSVGTSSANMIIATTSISAGQTVSCSSFTHTVLASSAGL